MSAGLSHRTGFMRIVIRALRFGLNWKLLLLWLLITGTPALLLVIPVWATLASLLDASIHAVQWASGFDLLMLFDLRTEFSQSGPAIPAIAVVSVVLLLLLKPLLDAVMISAVLSRANLRLSELLQAGLRGYWRMVRLLVWSVVVLGLAGGVAGGAFYLARKHAEQAILASDAKLGTRLAMAVALFAVLVARATLDAAQAGFVIEPARRSVFLAWWRGLKQIWQQPLRTLGGNLLLGLTGLLLLAVLGLARIELPTATALTFSTGVLVVLLLAAVPGWCHAARLYALVECMQQRKAGFASWASRNQPASGSLLGERRRASAAD